MSRKTSKNRMQLHVSVTTTTAQQIEELAEAMQIPQAAVIRQAVARWYRDEFAPRRTNGASKIIEEIADGVARTFSNNKETA